MLAYQTLNKNCSFNSLLHVDTRFPELFSFRRQISFILLWLWSRISITIIASILHFNICVHFAELKHKSCLDYSRIQLSLACLLLCGFFFLGVNINPIVELKTAFNNLNCSKVNLTCYLNIFQNYIHFIQSA